MIWIDNDICHKLSIADIKKIQTRSLECCNLYFVSSLYDLLLGLGYNYCVLNFLIVSSGLLYYYVTDKHEMSK